MRISRTLAGEYARVMSNAKEDREKAAEIFRQEAELESMAAIACSNAAEKTRRMSEAIKLASSGLDVAGTFTAEGSTASGAIALGQAGASVSETSLGMLQEGWEKRSGEMQSHAGGALELAAEAEQQSAPPSMGIVS